ncbi:hypothetical protein [Marinobacterium sp. BA1]|uniref:hypothetical protein n=1 Tax=Marinobacterium sp. BA1 TaxID=3138931 RepID=UPI0032E74B40
MDLALRREAVSQSLSALDAALHDWVGWLTEFAGPAWLLQGDGASTDADTLGSASSDEEAAMRRAAIAAFAVLDYPKDSTDGRQSWDCPGVLAVPPLALTEWATRINALKDAFRASVEEANEIYVDQSGQPAPPPAKARVTWHTVGLSYQVGVLPKGIYPLARFHLASIGRANLNLRQAWRHLNVYARADRAPDRIRFSWLHKRNVKRIPAAEVQARVLDMDASHPDIEQLQAMMLQIHPQEVLAHVQTPKPVLYATGYWPDRHRISLPASIPSLIPHDPQQTVSIQHPKNTPDPRSKQQRVKGRKLEDTPLIEMLSIYRYRPEFRAKD